MEEFEVRDALENLFSTKPDIFPTNPTKQAGYVMAY
jgi:hypothetical protein